MKKYMLLSTLLFVVNAMVPSDNSKKGELRRLVPDKSIKPCVVGFKNFTAEDLLALKEKYREVLNKTANPSYIERYFGMDNHTVSLEQLEKLKNMPKDVTSGMNFEVLPIERSYCINGCCAPNGCCPLEHGHFRYPVGISGAAGCFGSLALMATSIALYSQNPWFGCLAIPAAAAPFCGCASGECTLCVYYRCCAEREIVGFVAKSNDSENIIT